jgi:hypothetical protein
MSDAATIDEPHMFTYYKNLKKCPHMITHDMITKMHNAESKEIKHDEIVNIHKYVGIFGIFYDFINNCPLERSYYYDASFSSYTVPIKNNICDASVVNADGAYNIKIHDASYAHIKIHNTYFDFILSDGVFIFPIFTRANPFILIASVPQKENFFKIYTDGNRMTCTQIFFNSEQRIYICKRTSNDKFIEYLIKYYVHRMKKYVA